MDTRYIKNITFLHSRSCSLQISCKTESFNVMHTISENFLQFPSNCMIRDWFPSLTHSHYFSCTENFGKCTKPGKMSVLPESLSTPHFALLCPSNCICPDKLDPHET